MTVRELERRHADLDRCYLLSDMTDEEYQLRADAIDREAGYGPTRENEDTTSFPALGKDCR